MAIDNGTLVKQWNTLVKEAVWKGGAGGRVEGGVVHERIPMHS